MKLITTSWDDGHELDFRLAELLDKYKLQGTFYIPRHNSERPVMGPLQVQQLSRSFEIGGHTLHHTRLMPGNAALLEEEISGSFCWLNDLLGQAPVCFCFPGGVIHHSSATAVFRYGYKLARSTELLLTDLPSNTHLLPTTLQVYERSRFGYLRHLAKRGRLANLVQWMGIRSRTTLMKLTERYLDQAAGRGGCFHVWGHSWEIEKFGLWHKLEGIFRLLAERTDFLHVQNRQLLQYLSLQTEEK